MNAEINAYNQSQQEEYKAICELLASVIQRSLKEATSKIYHGAPVWFLDENPIVGYFVRKNNVSLLFWSGQSFDELGLSPEGKFKAAEAKYTHVDQVNITELNRWLEKSASIQWDYKNIVKRRGELLRLK